MKFEELLAENKSVIERFVHFRIANTEDAEDILQETYLAALKGFDSLNDKSHFKSWIIRIARNKCNDYYRMDRIDVVDDYDLELCVGKTGIGETFEIMELIKSLNENDREILTLYYFIGYSQQEISQALNIPIGTVKSRLYNARNNFKLKYAPCNDIKGDANMSLPKYLPEYTITKLNKVPFDVKCEELMGWLIIPRINEKIEWALYEYETKQQTERCELEVVGKAIVHDIEGVEIIAKEYNPVESNKLDLNAFAERRFIAQLTDSHCRFLAESHKSNGITHYYTFLDDNEFTKNWGYGVDNCGKEINLSSNSLVTREHNNIVSDSNVMDIVGRYAVTINGKTYDTVCLMDIETYDEGVVTEQYIDKSGRTILWRRFNADDWKYEKYNQLWSEKLPNNDSIKVNDKTYIHWYDCISCYICS